MALPTIRALAKVAEVIVAAPAWGRVLYRPLPVVERGEVPEADAAVLLAPSFRAAWEARHVPRRIGVRWDLRTPLLTDPVERLEEHRTLEYARLAAVLGVEVSGRPRFEATEEARSTCRQPAGHVALIPRSASGEVVEWPGFAALARALPDAVVYVGPHEDFEGGIELGLDDLAAALERARVVVVNDSGLSHFACAVGARTLVLHGSTTASRTGAVGSEALEGPDLECRPCYKKSCHIGGVPCLDIPVERVLSAIEA